MSVIVLLTLSALVILNYSTCRDFRYPPVLMCGVWLIVMTLYYLSPLEINPIGIVTVLIFISTTVAFSAGGYLTLALHESDPSMGGARLSLVDWPSASARVKLILLTLSGAAFPLIIRRASQLASQSGYDNFFVALRTEFLATDTGGYGYLNYGFFLSFFATFLYAIEPRSRLAQRLQFYLSLTLSLGYATLGTGRSTFLFIIATLSGIAVMQGRFNIKKLVVSALVFLFVFVFFGIAAGKGGYSDAPLSDNISSVGESLLDYVVGPIPAFDQVTRADLPLGYGKNMLIGPLNSIRGFAGRARVTRLRGDVYVPFATNVYTGINAPYQDFGIVGVTFVFAMIGAICTYFYLRGLAGDSLYIFCYAVSLYPLLLVAFSDEYFDPLNDWIKYGLCAYLYFRIGKGRQSETTLAQSRLTDCRLL
jgi:oligosaccharide repeat unit polymerase